MIRFNSSILTPKTFEYINDAFNKNHISGDGEYSKLCHKWFIEKLNCHHALLTHSCTGALEMAAILADLKIGDEVIMPSYTFCSTANAFALRGAVPVFIDIREDTLNMDEKLISDAITPRTKAIVPVHYAGIGCEMDEIMNIAKNHNLLVIEDAAQAFCSYYKNRPLGTIGDIGCMSLHETKNIASGEGGLFICNNKKLIERSEIIREKGTNRSNFHRGQIDKYTWIDIGSSYLPSDILAAYLYSLLEIHEKIQEKRIKIWQKYYESFSKLELSGKIKRPFIPKNCSNNGHMFYLLLNNLNERTEFIKFLYENEIYAPFHYVPLHSSPAGKKFCKTSSKMKNTDKVSETLVRLPIHFNLTEREKNKIINIVLAFINK